MSSDAKNSEKEEAKARLLGILKPGSKVYGIVRSVSRSGMSRRIDFYTFEKDGSKLLLTGNMATLGIGSYSRDAWASGAGMRVDGCGMDMVFNSIYTLGRILWPKGDGKTVTGRNGSKGPETDGGYLLKSESL